MAPRAAGPRTNPAMPKVWNEPLRQHRHTAVTCEVVEDEADRPRLLVHCAADHGHVIFENAGRR